MWNLDPKICPVLTRDLPGGDGVGVQLIGVQQPRQSFGSTALVFITGEVLPLNSEVGEKSWKGREEGGRSQSTHAHQNIPLYHCVPSEVSVRTRCSSSIHSVVSLRMSLKAFTGCPRNPSGSLVAAVERTSSLSAHLDADMRVLSPSTFTRQLLLTAEGRRAMSWHPPVHKQEALLFDLGQFVLLSSDVLLQRGDQVLLREQQVGHVTCRGRRQSI